MPGKANSVGFPIVNAFVNSRPFLDKLSKQGLTNGKLPPIPVRLGIKASISRTMIFFFFKPKTEDLLPSHIISNRIPYLPQTSGLKSERSVFQSRFRSFSAVR
jgi:hypothetical protein